MPPLRCDCGSGKAYDLCCGPCLEGEIPAPDPEALMRSRYTAFCRKNTDYLIATTAPGKGEPERLRQELNQTMASTRWLGLKVIDSGMKGPDRGWVEFAAFFSQGGVPGQLHESSSFLKIEGRWVYGEGEILPALKLGRNEVCFCGSGKKYKKCHGREG